MLTGFYSTSESPTNVGASKVRYGTLHMMQNVLNNIVCHGVFGKIRIGDWPTASLGWA